MFNFTNAAVIPNPNVVLLNPTTGAVTAATNPAVHRTVTFLL
jgi:hypothetical protein